MGIPSRQFWFLFGSYLEIPADDLGEDPYGKSTGHFKTVVRTQDEPGCTYKACNQYGDRDIGPRNIGIFLTKKDEEGDQAAHRSCVQTYFIKNGAHPGRAHDQKSPEYEMGGYGWRIRQVSQDITGPKVKKHRDDEPHQAVIAVF